MAHFYGTLEGSRGEVTRTADREREMTAYAASWRGAVRICVYQKNGVDWAVVSLVPWHGAGVHRELYSGPVDGRQEQGSVAWRCPDCHRTLTRDQWTYDRMAQAGGPVCNCGTDYEFVQGSDGQVEDRS